MKRTIVILLGVALAACGRPADEATEPAVQEPAAPETRQTRTPDAPIYAAAVANESRPAADRARDANRKPAAILEFFGIEPGMTVLDLFSGGGYYTELLSHVVGSSGHVVAHSNEPYLGLVGEEFEFRHSGGRLPNTEVLMAENNELQLEPDSFDAIMLGLTFHDFYHTNDAIGWAAIDVDTLLAELFEALRSGGVMVIVDHYAEAGAPVESGGSRHRIDPAIVVAAMTRAGFVLEAQSDLLRNPDDDYDKSAFDPAVRGRTDRFVMRFVKPE